MAAVLTTNTTISLKISEQAFIAEWCVYLKAIKLDYYINPNGKKLQGDVAVLSIGKQVQSDKEAMTCLAGEGCYLDMSANGVWRIVEVNQSEQQVILTKCVEIITESTVGNIERWSIGVANIWERTIPNDLHLNQHDIMKSKEQGCQSALSAKLSVWSDVSETKGASTLGNGGASEDLLVFQGSDIDLKEAGVWQVTVIESGNNSEGEVELCLKSGALTQVVYSFSADFIGLAGDKDKLLKPVDGTWAFYFRNFKFGMVFPLLGLLAMLAILIYIL